MMKLKICGMKYKNNINEVAQLRPDYMGFIFYEKSSRYIDTDIPVLPNSIQKVGVFVNASLEFVLRKIKKYNLEAVQLHGQESPDYIKNLRKLATDSGINFITILKVFSIKDDFNFSILIPFEDICDYFLFDTKGKLPGGNGYTFNWDVLKNYPSTKPFFLSGGIGLDEIDNLKDFRNTKASKYCYAIDVNSRFELEAGLKNSKELETFKNELQY